MTNAERQARFRRRRQAELKRLKEQKARDSGGDWREGKTPEEIAELDDLARQYREADERCTSAIDMELQGLREIAEVADELSEIAAELFEIAAPIMKTDRLSVRVRQADRSQETLGEKF